MRKSIGGSFLFLRSRKGGGAYESDLNMAGKQSTPEFRIVYILVKSISVAYDIELRLWYIIKIIYTGGFFVTNIDKPDFCGLLRNLVKGSKLVDDSF